MFDRFKIPVNMKNSLFILLSVCVVLGYSQNLTAPFENYLGNTRTCPNWGSINRNSYLNPTNEKDRIQIAEILKTHDFMTNSMSGIQSGRVESDVANYMNKVEQTKGESVRSLYRNETSEFSKLLAKSDKTVYLQMGNEINAFHFNQTMKAWAKSFNKPYPSPTSPFANDGDRIGRNDRGYIGYFVEYFLAPAIEGINEAKANSTNPDRIKVMLGSIANAHRDSAFNMWLPILWNYTVQGEFAPKLKGKKVSELVDGITIHYVLTEKSDLKLLERYYNLYGKQNKIVFTTEELGGHSYLGLGATTGIMIFARYMDVWTRLGYSPENCKMMFYNAHTSFMPAGDKVEVDHVNNRKVRRTPCPDASADSAMKIIEDFMPKAVLSNAKKYIIKSPIGFNEFFAFNDINSNKKIIIAHANDATKFDYVDLNDKLTSNIQTTCYLFTESNTQKIPVIVLKTKNGIRLKPQAEVKTSKQSSLLILLNTGK